MQTSLLELNRNPVSVPTMFGKLLRLNPSFSSKDVYKTVEATAVGELGLPEGSLASRPLGLY